MAASTVARLLAAQHDVELAARAHLGLPGPDGAPGSPRAAAHRTSALQQRLAAAAADGDRGAVRLLLRADAIQQRLDRAREAAAIRRQQALETGLDALRACTTTRELVDRAPEIARAACGARQLAIARIRDDVRSPWRQVAAGGAAFEPRPGRRGPRALDDLDAERRAAREGTVVVQRPDAGAAGDEVLVVAPIRRGPDVLGLLEAQFPDPAFDDPEIDAVLRLAGAVGRAFSTLAERARLQTQERVAARLRDDLADGAADDAAGELPTAEPGDRRTVGSAPRADPFATLTPRQRETLELLALGLSNHEIADRLVVGLSTAKSHVGAVLRAAGALNRTEAVKRYVESRGDDGPGRAPRS